MCGFAHGHEQGEHSADWAIPVGYSGFLRADSESAGVHQGIKPGRRSCAERRAGPHCGIYRVRVERRHGKFAGHCGTSAIRNARKRMERTCKSAGIGWQRQVHRRKRGAGPLYLCPQGTALRGDSRAVCTRLLGDYRGAGRNRRHHQAYGDRRLRHVEVHQGACIQSGIR